MLRELSRLQRGCAQASKIKKSSDNEEWKAEKKKL
jgi:hypothetical protein